eukprot:246543_1
MTVEEPKDEEEPKAVEERFMTIQAEETPKDEEPKAEETATRRDRKRTSPANEGSTGTHRKKRNHKEEPIDIAEKGEEPRNRPLKQEETAKLRGSKATKRGGIGAIFSCHNRRSC